MDKCRIFKPVVRGLDSVEPSDIVWYDDEDGVSRMSIKNGRTHLVRTPVVMFIDGGCRGNGTDWAFAGFGVYLGRRLPYNCYGKLPSRENHTSQAAEIYAARRAVNFQLRKIGDEVCQDGVVIITDSDYLFRSITGYICKRVDNGFLNAKGRPVTNGDAFARLNNGICKWEDSGIRIQFWKVPQEQNPHADRLANKALDY